MCINKLLEECSSFISYDFTTWPYVVVTIQPGDPEPNAFNAHLDVLKYLLEQESPFSITINTTGGSFSNIGYVRQQATFLKNHKDLIQKTLVCSSLVTENSFTRMALDILFKFVKPQRPNGRFACANKAAEWTLQQWEESNKIATTCPVQGSKELAQCYV